MRTAASDRLGIFFSDSHFENHRDSVISKKFQSLSNQRFKHKSVHKSSSYLTPALLFEPKFH